MLSERAGIKTGYYAEILQVIETGWLRVRFARLTNIQAVFFFSSRRRHTRFDCDWSSDVCSSDLYRVKVAVDGMEGLTAVKSEDFDLVISDVEMPRMDGFELTAKIRADKKLSELPDRKSTRLNSSHSQISYAVFCLKKKKYTIALAVSLWVAERTQERAEVASGVYQA